MEIIFDFDGSVVTIDKAGIRHSIHGQRITPKNALAILHTKALIKNDVTNGKALEKGDPNERLVGGVVIYFSGIDIDGKKYPVTIRVSRAKGYQGTGLSLYNIRTEKNKPLGQESVGRKSPPQLDKSEGLVFITPGHKLEVKYSKDGTVQGIYDPLTGKSYIIAGNIKKGEARGVFMHEIGIHMAADKEFRQTMQPIIKRAQQIVNVGIRNGDPTATEAHKRLIDGGEKESNAEEACAYLTEVAANSKKLSGPIRQWFRRLKAVLNAWLIRQNFRDVKKLSAQDIVDIALSNVLAIAKESVKTSNPQY